MKNEANDGECNQGDELLSYRTSVLCAKGAVADEYYSIHSLNIAVESSNLTSVLGR